MPGRRYRMPTHFGPAPGPRQTLDGGRYECRDDPRQVIVHAAYAAEVDQLDAFMPPGFVVRRGEIAAPFCYMTEVAWLAGRGCKGRKRVVWGKGVEVAVSMGGGR